MRSNRVEPSNKDAGDEQSYLTPSQNLLTQKQNPGLMEACNANHAENKENGSRDLQTADGKGCATAKKKPAAPNADQRNSIRSEAEEEKKRPGNIRSKKTDPIVGWTAYRGGIEESEIGRMKGYKAKKYKHCDSEYTQRQNFMLVSIHKKPQCSIYGKSR